MAVVCLRDLCQAYRRDHTPGRVARHRVWMRFALRCWRLSSSVSRGCRVQYLWSGRPRWWFPFSKMGTRGCASIIGVITQLSLPGKVYSRVLERRLRPIVEPQIQEEQCGFHPGHWAMDQLLPLQGCWGGGGGGGEFAHPVYMCFVDLEKAFDHVPRGILWGVLMKYGVGTSHLDLVQPKWELCWERVAAPSEGVQVSRDLLHE